MRQRDARQTLRTDGFLTKDKTNKERHTNNKQTIIVTQQRQ
jgi:hypothetical protein